MRQGFPAEKEECRYSSLDRVLELVAFAPNLDGQPFAALEASAYVVEPGHSDFAAAVAVVEAGLQPG